MLVLNRKPGESFVLDGDLRVVVLKLQGNRVTVGIAAPPDVEVWRAELEPTRRHDTAESAESNKESFHARFDLRS